MARTKRLNKSYRIINSVSDIGRIGQKEKALLSKYLSSQSIEYLIEIYSMRGAGLHLFKCTTVDGIEGYGVSASRCQAAISAMSEAIERRALFRNKLDNTKFCNWALLKKQHRIQSLQLYNRQQYATLANRFTDPYIENIHWARLREFGTRRTYYWPADLVSFKFTEFQRVSECTSTGTATATTKKRALLSALLEVIERDAFITNFFKQVKCSYVKLNTLPNNLVSLVNKLPANTNIRIYKQRNSLGVPCYSALIWSGFGNKSRYGIGAAAALDSDIAILKCVQEAIFTYQHVDSTVIYRPRSANNIKSLLDHFAFYQCARFSEILKLNGSEISYKRNTINELQLYRKIKSNGHKILYYEFNDCDTRGHPFFTVRVVIPGMLDLNIDPKLFRFGSTRMRRIKASLAMRGCRLSAKPHPFS